MSSERPAVPNEPSMDDSSSVAKKPYEPPRIEKRRSVARVTLLSGMGQMGVGVIMGNMGMGM